MGSSAVTRTWMATPRMLDRRLVGDADLGVGQLVALRDADLRLHQVAPGDHLGDRVLDLDARVDLDEVVAAVLADQELDRAGVGVVRVARDLERVVRQLARAAPRGSDQAGAYSTTFW